MTTRLIGNKKIESTISLTKSNIFPNHLYLLTNPLLNKKYKKTINKINKNIKEQDTGYIVPLNVDNKIKDLNKLIKNYEINQYPLHKYYKLNNNTNNIIYQYIDNELYILTIVIKDFFKHEKELLFSNITNSLIFISNNFKNELKKIYKKKKNIRYIRILKVIRILMIILILKKNILNIY